jgi:hypothetical protein
MATSIQPEAENQETPQPEQQSDTTNNTPPADNNTPQGVNVDEVHNLYRGVLGEYSQRAANLERELQDLRAQASRQPQNQNTPEQDVELLTTNPAELIRREIQASIAPLNNQVAQFQRAAQIDEYKRRMKMNPQFAQFMNNEKFIPYFENLLNQTQQINDNSAYAAYMAAVGMFVQSPDYNPNPTPAPIAQPTHHSQTVPTPPANRPAPPQQIPNNQNRGPQKTYTENEKLLMRMRKMTPEQWEAELALSPSQVVTGPQG